MCPAKAYPTGSRRSSRLPCQCSLSGSHPNPDRRLGGRVNTSFGPILCDTAVVHHKLINRLRVTSGRPRRPGACWSGARARRHPTRAQFGVFTDITVTARWRLSMCAHARLAKAKSQSTVLHVGRISENSFITVAMRQNDWRTESRACRLGRRRGPGGTRIQNGTEITESRRYLVGQGARHPTAFATHTTMTQHNDAIQWPLSDWPLAGQTLAT